jgi:hypothetical protein
VEPLQNRRFHRNLLILKRFGGTGKTSPSKNIISDGEIHDSEPEPKQATDSEKRMAVHRKHTPGKIWTGKI